MTMSKTFADDTQESREYSPRPNPLASVMECLSYPVQAEIAEIVDSCIAEDSFSDGVNNNGWSWTEMDCQPATNDECARWDVDLRIEAMFDVRKPLPRQVSKWLRLNALKMFRAAELLETVRDDRNRSVIQRLVSDDDFLQDVIKHGREFNYDGSFADEGE